jgi:thioredoxin-related protein
MLQGSLSYPTSIFLNGYSARDSSFALNLIAPGYLDRQNIEPLLVFTLENVFRNSNFEDFSKEFKTAFNDSLMALRKETGKWLKPDEVFISEPAKAKKSLMLVTTPWCNSGRVMLKTSFSDPAVSGYIDSTYRLIEFNPEIKDTLFYQKEMYRNPGTPTPFHQLAHYLSRNNLIIPTLVILDENLMPLDIIPFYLPPAAVGKISRFYGSGYNQKMTWQEFLQKGL